MWLEHQFIYLSDVRLLAFWSALVVKHSFFQLHKEAEQGNARNKALESVLCTQHPVPGGRVCFLFQQTRGEPPGPCTASQQHCTKERREGGEVQTPGDL